MRLLDLAAFCLRTVQDTHIETGRLFSTSGKAFVGVKVTFGGASGEAERTFKDIEKIFKSDPSKFKTREERTPQGKFKAYYVETA